MESYTQGEIPELVRSVIREVLDEWGWPRQVEEVEAPAVGSEVESEFGLKARVKIKGVISSWRPNAELDEILKVVVGDVLQEVGLPLGKSALMPE